MTNNRTGISYWVQSPWMGIGRTVVALGQLSVFVFAEPLSLFVPVAGSSFEDSCSTWYGQFSYFCFLPSVDVACWLSVLGLVIVASGFLPTITCVIHAYASVSFVAVLTLPDGGDLIASAISLLLVPLLITDTRLSVWKPSSGGGGGIRQGIQVGSQFGLRIQVAFIYFNSATAKFAVEPWANGSEMYYVVRQEMFGASGWLGELSRWATSFPLVTLGMSWGAIGIELCIVVLCFSKKKKAAIAAISLTLFLHVGIGLLIGINSFAMNMVGAVVLAVYPAMGRHLSGGKTVNPGMSAISRMPEKAA